MINLVTYIIIIDKINCYLHDLLALCKLCLGVLVVGPRLVHPLVVAQGQLVLPQGHVGGGAPVVRLQVHLQVESNIHLIWSKGDTVKFSISMSHNFCSDFDINCPTFCPSSRTNSYHIQLTLCTFLDNIWIHLPISIN